MQRVLAGVNGARHVIGHLLARFKTQRVTVERPSFAFLRFAIQLYTTARKQHPFVSQLYSNEAETTLAQLFYTWVSEKDLYTM